MKTFDISNLDNLILQKYQRSTTLDCKDIRMDKFEFVAKTLFLVPFCAPLLDGALLIFFEKCLIFFGIPIAQKNQRTFFLSKFYKD